MYTTKARLSTTIGLLAKLANNPIASKIPGQSWSIRVAGHWHPGSVRVGSRVSVTGPVPSLSYTETKISAVPCGPRGSGFRKNTLAGAQHIQRRALSSVCPSGVFRMCEGGQWVWGRKSPSGVQGQSPGRGSGDEVPQKLTLFCY